MCAPASLNCFVGTMEGRLLHYTRTFFREKVEPLHNIPEEGAVTQVKYQFGLVVWSTTKKIRVIHFKRNKQKICMIPIPGVNPNIPPHMYVSNLTMPKILLKINHDNKSRIADPNVEIYIAWVNEIKKVNLEYKQRIDRFDATTQFTKDMGSKFIAGLNTCMLKERYTVLEFDHVPESENGSTAPDASTKVERKKIIPYLTTLNYKWQESYSECLEIFGSMYQDLHYNTA